MQNNNYSLTDTELHLERMKLIGGLKKIIENREIEIKMHYEDVESSEVFYVNSLLVDYNNQKFSLYQLKSEFERVLNNLSSEYAKEIINGVLHPKISQNSCKKEKKQREMTWEEKEDLRLWSACDCNYEDFLYAKYINFL